MGVKPLFFGCNALIVNPPIKLTKSKFFIYWFFWGIKHSTSVWVQTKKSRFLPNFAANFLPFFSFLELFNLKNAENDYFNQHLECAAPKRWSKYTTYIVWSSEIFDLCEDLLLHVNLHKRLENVLTKHVYGPRFTTPY